MSTGAISLSLHAVDTASTGSVYLLKFACNKFSEVVHKSQLEPVRCNMQLVALHQQQVKRHLVLAQGTITVHAMGSVRACGCPGYVRTWPLYSRAFSQISDTSERNWPIV